MGVLPLQYLPGDSAASLGLDGTEKFTILGVGQLKVGQHLEVLAKNNKTQAEIKFKTLVRLDTEFDVQYFNNGGILQTVLKNLIKK